MSARAPQVREGWSRRANRRAAPSLGSVAIEGSPTRQLRRVDARCRTVPPAAAAAPAGACRVFVGRASQMSGAAARWWAGSSRRAPGRASASSSERPGIGKSRLVRELALEAREQRARSCCTARPSRTCWSPTSHFVEGARGNTTSPSRPPERAAAAASRPRAADLETHSPPGSHERRGTHPREERA